MILSPGCNPAIAAGLSGIILPNIGSVEGVSTPAVIKIIKKRITGKIKFITDPALITINLAQIGLLL